MFHKHESRTVPTVEQQPVEDVSKFQSKALVHINSYPLVQETEGFLSKVPAARILAANTKPIYESVVNSKPAQWVLPLTKMVDSIADRTLSLTDRVVPSLKTKTYHRLGEEAMLPYTYTKSAVGKVGTATISAADTYVYTPTHNQVLKFRQFYNEKVYDTHGRPLIRSSLDPIVAPCNKKFEAVTHTYLPEGKQVPTDGYNSEISRSAALTVNLVQRAAPIAESRVTNLVLAPYRYAKHVNSIFNHNLDKQEDLSLKNSWIASKNAVAELNKETLDYVRNTAPVRKMSRSKRFAPASAVSPIAA